MDDKTKITIKLDSHAAAGLERLARHWKLSKAEVVARLIKAADSDEAEEVLQREGPKAQTIYYDGPKS